MTSKQQLLLWAYGFTKKATVGKIMSIGVPCLIDLEGVARSLEFVAWAFYTGFANHWCEWQVKTCRSCCGVYAEIALSGCKIPGFHLAPELHVRYNRTKYGPRTYRVGIDGLRTSETEELMKASKQRSLAREKEKTKGMGTL